MTVKEIHERLDTIKGYRTGRIESPLNPTIAANQELAKLWYDVLRAVADGAYDPQALAEAALTPMLIRSDEWEV